jgi:hypothetical protein
MFFGLRVLLPLYFRQSLFKDKSGNRIKLANYFLYFPVSKNNL